MAMAAPGQLNVNESPSWGSRSVDCFEKLEQIGEGTYGLVFSHISPWTLLAFLFLFSKFNYFFLLFFHMLVEVWCGSRFLLLFIFGVFYVETELKLLCGLIYNSRVLSLGRYRSIELNCSCSTFLCWEWVSVIEDCKLFWMYLSDGDNKGAWNTRDTVNKTMADS